MFRYSDFFLARRYLFSKKKERFLSVTIRFSCIGIIIGVATLIVVTSVMNGFQYEIVDKLTNINGHIVLKSDSGITDKRQREIQSLIVNNNSVKKVVPLIKQDALVSCNGVFDGVVVMASNSDIVGEIVNGSIVNNTAGVGIFFAKKYGINIGDKITIISRKILDVGGCEMPTAKTFVVGYIFDAGIYQYNTHVIFLPFDIAKKIFEVKGVTDIQIWVENPLLIYKLEDCILSILRDNEILTDWKDYNSNLLHAVKVEKNVMFVILTLIILVAGFSIITSMVMLVKDKVKDIAILKTIGFSTFSIMKIFFYCGAMIGLCGTIVGGFMGVAFAYYVNDIKKLLEKLLQFDLFPAEIYYLLELPSKIEISEILLVIFVALLISFLSAIFPAIKAAKMKPLDILRYE